MWAGSCRSNPQGETHHKRLPSILGGDGMGAAREGGIYLPDRGVCKWGIEGWRYCAAPCPCITRVFGSRVPECPAVNSVEATE